MLIKDSPIHGKGVFAQADIAVGKSWTFPLEEVCCESHCFVIGTLADNSSMYLGTFDWPYYLNSTWPHDTAANLSFSVDANTMTLIITVEQSIKKNEELTLPYDWTIHNNICKEDKSNEDNSLSKR